MTDYGPPFANNPALFGQMGVQVREATDERGVKLYC
jgi:hypothetical protein